MDLVGYLKKYMKKGDACWEEYGVLEAEWKVDMIFHCMHVYIFKNKEKLKYLCLQMSVYWLKKQDKFVTSNLRAFIQPGSGVEETVVSNPMIMLYTSL